MITSPLQAALVAYYAAVDAWARAQTTARLGGGRKAQEHATAREAVLHQARRTFLQVAGAEEPS